MFGLVFLSGFHRAAVFTATIPGALDDGKVLAVGMAWFVYMLRCADGTLYTGTTTDIERRVVEHNGGGAAGKGAKYTKARRPVSLVYSESVVDRSTAQIREAAVKKLSKSAKLQLVDNASKST